MSFTPAYNDPWFPRGLRSVAQALGLQDGAAARGLMFGLRRWLAVCLSLYVSLWLQLDNPYWSGISAAVVCQPGVGAALRKGVARFVGTFAGAVAMVVLAALFPQDRVGFLFGLAVWGGACGFLAAALRDQASYATALAGYTAAIVAGSLIDASGAARGDAFILALTRVTEIWIGLLSAQLVFIATDVGRARGRLAESLEGLVRDIGVRLAESTEALGSLQDPGALGAWQFKFVARIEALEIQISDAIAEEPDLRPCEAGLRAAAIGLFAALSGAMNQALDGPAAASSDRGTDPPLDFSQFGGPRLRQTDLSRWRQQMRERVRARVRYAAASASLQVLSDNYAEALLGLVRALDALAIVAGEGSRPATRSAQRTRPLDWLPALLVAARVIVAIGAVEVLWVATAWPDGGSAVAYVAVSVILFSPRGALGYAGARTFLMGCSLGVVLGGLVRFLLLPLSADFAALCAALAVTLIPLGVLSQRVGGGAFYIFAAVNFGVGLNTGNLQNYNVTSFYNQSLAIAVGSFAAVAAIALAPPLSTNALLRRATLATVRGVRELAGRGARTNLEQWGRRVFGRLEDLPTEADPRLLSCFAAAATAGAEVIRLRRLQGRLRPGGHQLALALEPVARGELDAALAQLAALEQAYAKAPTSDSPALLTNSRVHAALGRLIASLRLLTAASGAPHELL